MNFWNKTSNFIPEELELIEVRDSSGTQRNARIIFLETEKKYVWIDDFGKTYPIELFDKWRYANLMKNIKLSDKIYYKIKRMFSRKYWVVTCITEELDIYSQSIFGSKEKAYEYMINEYHKMSSVLGIDVVESHTFSESATILYGKEPLCFEWKITCIIK